MRDRTTEHSPEVTIRAAKTKRAPAPDVASPLLDLQRTAGNAAVVSMVEEPVRRSGGLEVGAVNDPAEREADQIADQVLRELDAGAGIRRSPLRRVVRRAAAGDASGAPGHGAGGGPVDADVERQIQAARGGGAPLDPVMREEMEGAFGADFSGIRVHQGSQADSLNRSLNAKAFTTGSDIFFSGGAIDRRTMAHELAHTVQQGAAVRRFVPIKTFQERTNEGTFVRKSTAQSEIEKLLTKYTALCGQPQGDKKPQVPDEKLDQAIELVTTMRTAADLWVKAHTDAQGKMDSSRQKRAAGMAWFIMAADSELTGLRKRRDDKVAAGTAQLPVESESAAVDKLKARYEGSLGTGLDKAAALLAKVVPNEGDSTEFELSLKIPVATGAYVGAILRFEAKKDEQTEISLEAAFQAGGNLGIVDIHGALGGYIKASGATPELCMKMISYAMYRKCKESSVIPSEISSMIWGGDTSAKAKQKAEDWSKQVERQAFGEGSENSVELGGLAEVGVDVDAGVVEAGGAAKYTSGTRYDAESMKKKGGAGEDNTMGSNWFAQQSTGRSTNNLELSAKFSALGVMAGDVKLVLSWRDSGGGTNPTSTLEELELQVRGSGRMPAAGFEAALTKLCVEFANQVKSVARGQMAKASTMSKVAAVGTTSYGIADTTLQGVEGMPITEALKKNTLDRLLEPSPPTTPESESTGPTNESQIGVELAYNMKQSGGKTTNSIELRQLSSMNAKIPALLQAELVRRKRLIGGRSKEGGPWAWLF